MNKYTIKLISFIALTTGIASGDTWYVDINGGLNGDGLAWSTAFQDLAEALEFAEFGDEIWVREGLHQPTIAAAGSADSGFFLSDGVGVYGGFDGTETLRSQRDPVAHVTILSAGATTEVLHVLEGVDLGPSTIIDGFTIMDGSGGDDGIGGVGGAGGGMMLINSSPTVVDCIIKENATRLGSGVYVQDGSPSFERCAFIGNQSVRSGEGGAIYSIVTNPGQTQTLDIVDCQFSFNSVRQGHWATGNGGAIYTSDDVMLTVQSSTFTSNFGWHNSTFGNPVAGGAIAVYGDGALIEDCTFTSNYSNLGAGIFSAGDIQINQSFFVANRAVVASTCGGFDCPGDIPDLFSGWGGAVFVSTFALADINQCTIASNWAADTGGGVVAHGSIRNSILWGNLSPERCCGEDPLPISRMQYEHTEVVEYSCIEGLLTPELGEDPPNPANFPGSNEDDPQFRTTTLISQGAGWLVSPVGDHRLISGSPAIDSGSNTLVPAGMLLDLDGLDRFIDDPGTPDTGPDAPSVVDMGAWEFQTPNPCPADITGDGSLDFFDVSAFLTAFGDQDPAADFTDDGSFDFFDVSTFLAAFSAGCP